MLKFNIELTTIIIWEYNLNTSYVKVQFPKSTSINNGFGAFKYILC